MYDYDHSDNYITQTTVIKGDTNSPDITNVTKTDCDGFVTYTKQNGVETTYTNDMLGNALTTTTDGCTTKMEYNGVGNVTKVTKPLGGVYKYTYDTLGRKTSETLPNGGTTTYDYDNLDRLILEKSPITDNNTKSEKSYTYDKNGNVLTEKIKTNAVGSSTATYSTTNYSYDEKNNLKRVQNVDNNGKVCYTEYEYDGVGNLLKSKAANGQNVTTYQYNSLNRVTKMTDPMGKSETYTYDISGNMINKVDRNNTNLVYEYDPMNRLTMERAKVGNDYVLKGYYAYTLTGNLKISQGYYNRFVMNYDEYGRLKNVEIKQNDNYFKYFYNYLDNKRGLVSNKYLYKYSNSSFTGSSTMYAEHKYTYDAENNVTKIQTRGTENPIVYKDLVSYTYDKTGNLTKEVKGNVTTDYTYNIGNLVTNMTNKNGQSVISTYSYSYNYDGNISKSVENGVTKNYKYDPMNRLVQENTKNNTYSYTYDNAGNRATMTATGSENFVKSYVYDKNNRLLEECKAVNNDKYITNYQYDNNGNTIEKVKSEVHSGNTGTQSLGIKTSGELPKTNSREYFKYNVFNQLSTYYSTTIGKYTTYKYLSNGYRCYKNVKGVESYFIWDGDEIGAEYDANGNVTDVLYRGNNLVRDSKGNNYVYDSHGSVTSILNDNGSKSKNYEYDAFGNIENETNASTYNPWQYCGEYTDPESGLIYLRNRYYDSETGRFINEDPARSGGNWYSYCSGNPVMFWDKFGLRKIIICGPEQEENEKEAIKSYEEIGEECVLITVKSAEEFEKTWNNLASTEKSDDDPYKDVFITENDDVIVNIHGSASSMSVTGKDRVNIENLDSINANSLTLLVCNAGNLDHVGKRDQNVAMQLLKNNNVNYVIAPDGTNRRIEGDYVKTIDDVGFKNNLQNNTNGRSKGLGTPVAPEGYIMYYNNSSNNVQHLSLGTGPYRIRTLVTLGKTTYNKL